MIGASKILTVSYGTFSCTLEGFDDPFNTMRAIAEYFRDLAAEDRYFGAEPPTPDAAMLHRIAEREINRRVEANIQENGVILRAGDISVTKGPQQNAMPAAAVVIEPHLNDTVATTEDSAASRLIRLREAQTASARATAEGAGPMYLVEDETDLLNAPVTAWDAQFAIEAAPDRFVEIRAEAAADAVDIIASEMANAAAEAITPTDLAQQDFTDAPDADISLSATTDQDDELRSLATQETKADVSNTAETIAPVMDEPCTDLPEIANFAEPADEATYEDTIAAVMADLGADLPEIADFAERADEATYEDTIAAVMADLGADLPEIADFAEPADEATYEDTIAAVMADLGADLPVRADVETEADLDHVMLTALADTDDEVQDNTASAWPLVDDVPSAEILLPEFETPERYQADLPDPSADARGHAEEVLADPVALPTDETATQITYGQMVDPDGEDEFDVAATVAQSDDLASRSDEEGPVQVSGQEAALDADDPSEMPESVFVPAPEPQVASPLSERLQRARARVIKIRRVDAVAAALPTEVALVAPVAEVQVPTPTAPALSPQAEADLQRELADLEADLRADAGPKPEASHKAEVPSETVDAAKLGDPATDDDAVERLISQTNAAMEGPENKRRLSAIAHLKAAVAATFADRKSNAAPAQQVPTVRMDPYRDDLDRVVRPRRPALVNTETGSSAQNGGTPTQRPQIENRPAPLVLVSEQRIDRPATVQNAPTLPVRPRRVTSELMAVETVPDDPRMPNDRRMPDEVAHDTEDDLGVDDLNNIFADPSQPFADFAERLGATSMPDLLEAAAAYCALQLGRPQFTRPLLLQQIADLPSADDHNREDCLRGFGTLLRDGRIQKIKRGQFKLSGHSRYLAEGKRSAG